MDLTVAIPNMPPEFYILGQVDTNTSSHLFLRVSGKYTGTFQQEFSTECIADTDDKLYHILNIYKTNSSIYRIYHIPVNGFIKWLSNDAIEQLSLGSDTTIENVSNLIESSPSALQLPATPERISADILKTNQIFHQLSMIHDSKEGNLLENVVDIDTRDSQVSFFKYAFDILKLNKVTRGHLLETGTNKGYFGFIASQFFGPTVLHTFDLNPNSVKTVQILSQTGMDVIFTCGDSTKELPKYNTTRPVIFSWIDGGHRYEEALIDLENAARLGSKFIAIDDMKFFRGSVDTAFYEFLRLYPEYVQLENPFWETDKVGIAWCWRKSDN